MTRTNIIPWKWGRLRDEDEGQPMNLFLREMDVFQRHMNRMFEDFVGGRFGRMEIPDIWHGYDMLPSLDQTEDDNAYCIAVELPGMDENDVQLTLIDDMLTIRGEKKVEDEEKGKDFYRSERSYGTFRRTVTLPREVDIEKIDATFDKGVLKITLPKTEEAKEKVKKIDVKAA